MKRLSLWLLFFAVLGIQSVLAQTYTVKGNVVSKTDNEPLIGVSILQTDQYDETPSLLKIQKLAGGGGWSGDLMGERLYRCNV